MEPVGNAKMVSSLATQNYEPCAARQAAGWISTAGSGLHAGPQRPEPTKDSPSCSFFEEALVLKPHEPKKGFRSIFRPGGSTGLLLLNPTYPKEPRVTVGNGYKLVAELTFTTTVGHKST